MINKRDILFLAVKEDNEGRRKRKETKEIYPTTWKFLMTDVIPGKTYKVKYSCVS